MFRRGDWGALQKPLPAYPPLRLTHSANVWRRKWNLGRRGRLKGLQNRLSAIRLHGLRDRLNVWRGDWGDLQKPLPAYPPLRLTRSVKCLAWESARLAVPLPPKTPERAPLLGRPLPAVYLYRCFPTISGRLRDVAGGCAAPRPVSSFHPFCAAIWRAPAFWNSGGFPESWRAISLR